MPRRGAEVACRHPNIVRGPGSSSPEGAQARSRGGAGGHRQGGGVISAAFSEVTRAAPSEVIRVAPSEVERKLFPTSPHVMLSALHRVLPTSATNKHGGGMGSGR
jgi:hypothetical protein